MLEVQRRAAVDSGSEKSRNGLERATKTLTTAGNAYTKAVDASIDMVGTGSGRVMVLLPSRAADNMERK